MRTTPSPSARQQPFALLTRSYASGYLAWAGAKAGLVSTQNDIWFVAASICDSVMGALLLSRKHMGLDKPHVVARAFAAWDENLTVY